MYYISNFSEENKKNIKLPPLGQTLKGTAIGALVGSTIGRVVGRTQTARKYFKTGQLDRTLGGKAGLKGAAILGGLNLGWNVALANSKKMRDLRAKDFKGELQKKIKKPIKRYARKMDNLKEYGEYDA